MAYVDTHPGVERADLLRWTLCAGAVALAHGLVVLALLARPDYADTEVGAPVVMIELAPITAAPSAPESDLAPGPQQLQAETREQMREETPQEMPEQTERVPDLTPAPNPAVTLPTPEPPKETPREQAKQEPAEAAPVPTAPPPAAVPAPRPASPAPGRVARPSSAEMTRWQRAIGAQLERNKRYPPGAAGEHGTVKLEFRIDRRGHVLASRIVQSSGSAALDQETLALLRRAEPFPTPPADIADAQLAFVVPIRYAAAGRR
jgi:periplasmic protein TonB